MIYPKDVFLELHPPSGLRHGVSQFRSLASAQQYRWIYQLTQRYVRPGQRVLDWGAGNGHFSQFLLQAGYHATAFAFGSPSPLLAELVQTRSTKFSYVAAADNEPVRLPFEAASYDAVASIGVLEHVRETGGNELGSLQEIHRILRPGGYFICCHFPNRFSWIEGLTFFFRSRFHHIYRYTRYEIEQMARASGFEVLLIQRYNAIPRNSLGGLPRWLQRSQPAAACIDFVDTVLTFILNPFCQNYGFALRKPTA